MIRATVISILLMAAATWYQLPQRNVVLQMA